MTKTMNDKQLQEDMERLNVIRARVRRSLDDPRPALSINEVRSNLEKVFAKVRKDGGCSFEMLYRSHDPQGDA